MLWKHLSRDSQIKRFGHRMILCRVILLNIILQNSVIPYRTTIKHILEYILDLTGDFNYLQMSLKDVYKTDREEKLAILPDLMQKQQISLEMILEFCRYCCRFRFLYNEMHNYATINLILKFSVPYISV